MSDPRRLLFWDLNFEKVHVTAPDSPMRGVFLCGLLRLKGMALVTEQRNELVLSRMCRECLSREGR